MGFSNLLYLKNEVMNVADVFTCWCKLEKVKCPFNIFLVGMAKKGHDLLGHRTLRSALSLEWIDEFSWFCHGDTDLEKRKV